LNAMGSAKIVIEFFGKNIEPTVRIHGTNKPRSIGKKESSGCIRMLNENIIEGTSLIRKKEVLVSFF